MTDGELLCYCIGCGETLGAGRDHRCPSCGRLFDPEDASTYRQADVQSVVIFRTGDDLEASLVCEQLVSEGVQAMIVGDTLHTFGGGLPTPALSHLGILVHRHREADARRIVDAWIRSHSSGDGADATGDQPAWRCPQCDETNDGHFELCWNCQGDRPGGGV